MRGHATLSSADYAMQMVTGWSAALCDIFALNHEDSSVEVKKWHRRGAHENGIIGNIDYIFRLNEPVLLGNLLPRGNYIIRPDHFADESIAGGICETKRSNTEDMSSKHCTQFVSFYKKLLDGSGRTFFKKRGSDYRMAECRASATTA